MAGVAGSGKVPGSREVLNVNGATLYNAKHLTCIRVAPSVSCMPGFAHGVTLRRITVYTTSGMTAGDSSSRPARTDTPPVSLAGRAADDLAFVRDVVTRSERFTAVPGIGGIAMGAIGIITAMRAGQQPNTAHWLVAWLIGATLAAVVGAVTLVQKARRTGTSLDAAPARRFAFGLVPPLLVGALFTIGAWRLNATSLIVPSWLMCYGLAVAAAGAVSTVRLVPRLGIVFIVLGALALATPERWHDAFMAAGFGVAHLVAGVIIRRHYGG